MVSKFWEGAHIHVPCTKHQPCRLLRFISTVILFIMLSTVHFDTTPQRVAVAPYHSRSRQSWDRSKQEKYLGGKTQVKIWKKGARTLSTATVKRHIIRAAAKCTLAKIILLLACALVFSFLVLHRAVLADMKIHCRICQAVEYAGWNSFCSGNSDKWGNFRGATWESGEPRGPRPQLRSTEGEKTEGHTKLHIQTRWIWPWNEDTCKASKLCERSWKVPSSGAKTF